MKFREYAGVSADSKKLRRGNGSDVDSMVVSSIANSLSNICKSMVEFPMSKSSVNNFGRHVHDSGRSLVATGEISFGLTADG